MCCVILPCLLVPAMLIRAVLGSLRTTEEGFSECATIDEATYIAYFVVAGILFLTATNIFGLCLAFTVCYRRLNRGMRQRDRAIYGDRQEDSEEDLDLDLDLDLDAQEDEQLIAPQEVTPLDIPETGRFHRYDEDDEDEADDTESLTTKDDEIETEDDEDEEGLATVAVEEGLSQEEEEEEDQVNYPEEVSESADARDSNALFDGEVSVHP